MVVPRVGGFLTGRSIPCRIFWVWQRFRIDLHRRCYCRKDQERFLVRPKIRIQHRRLARDCSSSSMAVVDTSCHSPDYRR
ncbi:MAG: hypothetical protein PVG86_06115 [Desulfobacterales bacterium]